MMYIPSTFLLCFPHISVPKLCSANVNYFKKMSVMAESNLVAHSLFRLRQPLVEIKIPFLVNGVRVSWSMGVAGYQCKIVGKVGKQIHYQAV